MAAIRFRVAGKYSHRISAGVPTYRASQYRHWDLCRHFGISSFDVVTDFALEMERAERLPSAMIPPFEVPAPQSAPYGPSSNTSGAQPVEIAILEQAREDGIRGSKGKQVLRSVVELPPPRYTMRKRGAPTETVSKQASSQSVKGGTGPSKLSGPAVGADSDDAMSIDDRVHGGLDLSGKSYLEGTRLDIIEFPLAERQACRFLERDRPILTSI
jgi:hypothetical protein